MHGSIALNERSGAKRRGGGGDGGRKSWIMYMVWAKTKTQQKLIKNRLLAGVVGAVAAVVAVVGMVGVGVVVNAMEKVLKTKTLGSVLVASPRLIPVDEGVAQTRCERV